MQIFIRYIFNFNKDQTMKLITNKNELPGIYLKEQKKNIFDSYVINNIFENKIANELLNHNIKSKKIFNYSFDYQQTKIIIEELIFDKKILKKINFNDLEQSNKNLKKYQLKIANIFLKLIQKNIEIKEIEVSSYSNIVIVNSIANENFTINDTSNEKIKQCLKDNNLLL